MIGKSKIEEIRERIISILDRYLGDEYILFLFGSLTNSSPDRISDIDLAVYSKKLISPSKIAQVKEEFRSKAGTLREIDLVNLTGENISEKLLEDVLEEGRIWKKPKNSEELLRNLKRRLKNLKK